MICKSSLLVILKEDTRRNKVSGIKHMSVSICVNQRVTVTTDVSESLTMPADLGSIKIETLENSFLNNRFDAQHKAIQSLDIVKNEYRANA